MYQNHLSWDQCSSIQCNSTQAWFIPLDQKGGGGKKSKHQHAWYSAGSLLHCCALPPSIVRKLSLRAAMPTPTVVPLRETRSFFTPVYFPPTHEGRFRTNEMCNPWNKDPVTRSSIHALQVPLLTPTYACNRKKKAMHWAMTDFRSIPMFTQKKSNRIRGIRGVTAYRAVGVNVYCVMGWLAGGWFPLA